MPPYDFEAAAKAIEWLIANPEAAEDMGRRGQKAVLEHYSWSAEFPKLLDLYKSVLD